MKEIAHKARVKLIQFSKVVPFFLCLLVWVSYAESLFALINESYVILDNSLVLNKPISWFIGDFFVYRWQIIIIIILLSLATETCIWNKLSVAYLCANILERDYFIKVELYVEYIYIICIINIVITSFLCYKGVKQLMR